MYWILKLHNNASSRLSFLYIQCIVGLLRRNDDANLGGSPSELKLKPGRVAPYYRTHDYWVEELLKRREESVWMAQMHLKIGDLHRTAIHHTLWFNWFMVISSSPAHTFTKPYLQPKRNAPRSVATKKSVEVESPTLAQSREKNGRFGSVVWVGAPCHRPWANPNHQRSEIDRSVYNCMMVQRLCCLAPMNQKNFRKMDLF